MPVPIPDVCQTQMPVTQGSTNAPKTRKALRKHLNCAMTILTVWWSPQHLTASWETSIISHGRKRGLLDDTPCCQILDEGKLSFVKKSNFN